MGKGVRGGVLVGGVAEVVMEAEERSLGGPLCF